MSITNTAQLWQAFDQTERLHRALEVLRQQVRPASPRAFELMAEGPLDQLRELHAEIGTYLATSEIEADGRGLWIGLGGPHIRFGDAPTSVVTSILDTFRKGVQVVAEFLMAGEVSTRPTADLKRACDFRILAVAPGSLRVAVRLPWRDDSQAELVEVGRDFVGEALRSYVQVAEWAGSDQEQSALAEAVSDDRLRRVTLTAVARLVPRERGELDFVELFGPTVTRANAIRLVRASKARISGAIDAASEESVETRRGILREIDLDEESFILRIPGQPDEVRCHFPADLLETAKESLDRLVEVTGTRRATESRRPQSRLEVSRLDIVEEEEA